MTGEKIYEYDLDVTGVTDYGVTLQAIFSSQASIPPQVARIDVAFEGRASGRLAGRVRGVDSLGLRDAASTLIFARSLNGGRSSDRAVCRRRGRAARY